MSIAPRPLLEDQVAEFLTVRRAAGLTAWGRPQRGARQFCARVQEAGGWAQLSLAGQLDVTAMAPVFAAWLIVTGQLTVSAEFLSRAHLQLGHCARRFCVESYQWFARIAEQLGLRSGDTLQQWSALTRIRALTGRAVDAIGAAEFERARAAIVEAVVAHGTPCAGKNMASDFYRLRLTLFHAGCLETYTRPQHRLPVSVQGWAVVAPGFTEAARRYIDQLALSLRPATVGHIEYHLREFGTWLAEHHRPVVSCADLERHHIEQFKALNLPRFGGHLRSHESAVGVCHGQTQAAVVHGGIQGAGGQDRAGER